MVFRRSWVLIVLLLLNAAVLIYPPSAERKQHADGKFSPWVFVGHRSILKPSEFNREARLEVGRLAAELVALNLTAVALFLLLDGRNRVRTPLLADRKASASEGSIFSRHRIWWWALVGIAAIYAIIVTGVQSEGLGFFLGSFAGAFGFGFIGTGIIWLLCLCRLRDRAWMIVFTVVFCLAVTMALFGNLTRVWELREQRTAVGEIAGKPLITPTPIPSPSPTQERPPHGVATSLPGYQPLASLTIIPSAKEDFVIGLFDNANGKCAWMIYIHSASDPIETNIPVGTFDVKFAAGNHWFGDAFFGADGRYLKLNRTVNITADSKRRVAMDDVGSDKMPTTAITLAEYRE